MSKSVKAILAELGACPEAVAWAGRKTPRRAWATCERADWMLWVAERLKIDVAAAWAAEWAVAWYAALKDMANIVREIIPFSVIQKAIADYKEEK